MTEQCTIFIASNFMEEILCLHHWYHSDFINNIVSASVENTNVVCLQSGTQYLYIFAIFSKTGFLDMVP